MLEAISGALKSVERRFGGRLGGLDDGEVVSSRRRRAGFLGRRARPVHQKIGAGLTTARVKERPCLSTPIRLGRASPALRVCSVLLFTRVPRTRRLLRAPGDAPSGCSLLVAQLTADSLLADRKYTISADSAYPPGFIAREIVISSGAIVRWR